MNGSNGDVNGGKNNGVIETHQQKKLDTKKLPLFFFSVLLLEIENYSERYINITWSGRNEIIIKNEKENKLTKKGMKKMKSIICS